MKKIVFCLCTLLIVLNACKETKKQVNENDFVKPELTKEEIANGILTPEILWKFGRNSDVQLSPDKSKIIYNISYYDLATNKSNTQIYMKNVDSEKNVIQLTNGNNACFNPRWLNDIEVAFITETAYWDKGVEKTKLGIKKININTKIISQISNFEEEVNSFELSPTGNRILFSSDIKLDKTPQDIYEDLPNTNVIIAEDLMYRHWNDWSDYKYSHIFVADKEGEKFSNTTDIMKNEKFDSPLSPYFDAAEISWSPDGNTIAYTCKKQSGKEYALSTNSDIYLYDIQTKTTKNITEGMLGYDKYPVFSPNGKQIAWTSMKTPGYEADKNRLFVMNLITGEKNDLTENFDFNTNSPLWSENNPENIRFLSEINGTVQVFEINIYTKGIKQISEGWHDYTQILNADDNIIGMKMSMKMSNEVFKLNSDGTEQQITFTNQKIYDNIKICDVQQKMVITTDNKKMLTWVITPPDFDNTKTYPAILYCEGGPQSQVSQFFSFRWNFQIMASNGYVVIAPNRRGLPGFGTEWNKQISGDYGGQNMKDYISAVETLKKEPYIDENRIGAVGASYGGFSVYWLAGHNENHLFKAFIAHCGMFNFESQYGGTEEMFFVNHDLGGAYWEKDNKIAKNSYANSPHRFVQNWNTPILIIAGMNDFRIPYTESLQAFDCAKLNGIDAKLLIFPEETHFVLKPQNSVLWQREFKSWLDKYLK